MMSEVLGRKSSEFVQKTATNVVCILYRAEDDKIRHMGFLWKDDKKNPQASIVTDSK